MKKIKLFDGNTGNTSDAIHDGSHYKDGKLTDKQGRTHAVDPNMVCCEIFNYMKFEIMFLDMLDKTKKPIYCKASDFCFLPHQHFTVNAVDSRNRDYPINILKNFGDNMFKRNTLPSRPEAKTKIIG